MYSHWLKILREKERAQMKEIWKTLFDGERMNTAWRQNVRIVRDKHVPTRTTRVHVGYGLNPVVSNHHKSLVNKPQNQRKLHNCVRFLCFNSRIIDVSRTKKSLRSPRWPPPSSSILCSVKSSDEYLFVKHFLLINTWRLHFFNWFRTSFTKLLIQE